MRCRRNYNELSDTDKARFVAALNHVKSTGLVDEYAAEHASHFDHGIHSTSHFLPWHRDFLRRFEDALRAFDPDVTIPYWDSSQDQATSGGVWDSAFLGQFDSAWNLNRALGSDTLPTPAQVDNALANFNSYDTFWPNLEVVIHNPPHRWVQGEMSQTDSPRDPVFYLHHCWIDMLWAQWQLRNPGAAFVSSGPGHGLDDPMHSVTTTPAAVIDHRTINIYHYPDGYTQDDPRVALDTPVVNFLNVPEGETRLGAAVFSLDACEPLTFTITAGPTVTSGPAGTEFKVHQAPVVADPHADSKARVWFTYKGTAAGDVATGTVTIHCEETGDDFVITLTADTIARPTAAIVMVLDQSNSMNFDSGIGPGIEREDVLKFSAPTAVVALDEANAMAVCSFDHDAHPGIAITDAAGAGKFTINAAVAAYAPNPNGWTSIGEGVAFAHGLLSPVTDHEVRAIVVLTDGQENHGSYTRRYISDVADLITSLNGRVFAIGLGRAEVLNAVALTALCSGNSGYMLTTGDLTLDATFRLAKYYQQIFAGVTNNEIVLDPEGFIAPGAVCRIPFDLNEADINAKAILLTPAPYAIRFALETPEGDIIDPGVASSHPMASLEVGAQTAVYRVGLAFPIGGHNSQTGRWHALLKVDDKYYKKYLSTLDHQAGASATAQAHGIRYCLNVHAFSNLRMRATISQSSYEPGATLTLRAILTEYGQPVAGRAHCLADMTRPDNTGATLAMPEVQAGVFEVSTSASQHGVYRFRIVAEGRTFRGSAFTREQTLTGSVWRGGDQTPPTSTDDPGRDNDRWCKLWHCLLSRKSIQEALRRAGINPDDILKCLQEFCRRPDPAQVPLSPRAALIQRLRALIPDENILKSFEEELDRS